MNDSLANFKLHFEDIKIKKRRKAGRMYVHVSDRVVRRLARRRGK